MTKEAAVAERELEVQLVPVEKIKESKTNPRKTFDGEAMKRLAESIEKQGLLHPIVLRPQNGSYELVCGARRFRAVKSLGRDKILAIVREYDDGAAVEAQITENRQRETVKPLEEAQGFKYLIDKGSHTVEMLAEKTGMTPSNVYMRLKLNDLIEPAKKALEHELLTASHAEKIARLQPDAQKRALTRCIPKIEIPDDIDDPDYDPYDDYCDKTEEQVLLPVRSLQKWIDENINTDLTTKAVWDLEEANLTPNTVSCLNCTKRTGNCAALFPEIKKDSVCTDIACFKAKRDAWFKRETERLSDVEGLKVAVISDQADHDYDEALEWVLYKGQWRQPGAKKCKSLALGLAFDGKDRGKPVGQVCIAKECSVHNPKPSYSSGSGSPSKPATPAQLAKEKRDHEERLRKNDRAHQLTQALFNAALDRAPGKPGPWELQRLGVYLAGGDMPSELRQIFPQFKGYGSEQRGVLKLKPKDLLKFIYGFSISEWDSVDEKLLAEACRRWKVPADQVKRELKKRWDLEDSVRKAKEAEAAKKLSRKEMDAVAESVVHEILAPELKSGKGPHFSKAKLKVPTCGRCGCTERGTCEQHEARADGLRHFVVLDRGTNHAICDECVTVEELGRINAKHQAKKEERAAKTGEATKKAAEFVHKLHTEKPRGGGVASKAKKKPAKKKPKAKKQAQRRGRK